MSWTVLIGAGVGIGVYILGNMLQSSYGQKKRQRKNTPVSPRITADAVKPLTEERGANSLREPRSVIDEVSPVPAPSSVKEPQVPRQRPPAIKPVARPTAPSPSKTGTRPWFLIKATNGKIMACQARDKTPKTIAGPFPTKAAAVKAKQA